MKEKTKNLIKVYFVFMLFAMLGAGIAKTLTEGKLDSTVAAGIGGGVGGLIGAFLVKFIFKLDISEVVKEYNKKD